MTRNVVMNTPIRAAIYARVSSERQAAEDRVSIDVQLKECEVYCLQHGYQIIHCYVDKEKYRVKGKLVQPSAQRKDRPAYQALLAAAYKDEFEIIVAWKEDRLYRGMYAAMPLAELLDAKADKLNVELVRETFDRKMLGIKAALGKIEVDNIRERMIMGRRARLEKGEVPGGDQMRYGYQKIEKKLKIIEGEALIICQVFEWYTAGENNMEIRRRLNSLGIAPRKSKLWSKATIENIITGEYYATGKLPTLLEGEIFYISCPPIISLDTWNKAVETRQANKTKARNVKSDYLCIGLVYCACGWKCQAKAIRSNYFRSFECVSGAYICQHSNIQPESRPPACVNRTGSLKVDNYVWNFVKRVCSNPSLVQAAIEAKLNKLQIEHINLEQELDKLKHVLDEVVTERQWIITQARKGRITEDDMSLQLGQLQIQESVCRKELDEYEALLIMQKQAETLATWAEQYLSDLHAGLKALEVDVTKLSEVDFDSLFSELQAWRFTDKFPADRSAQLKWAVLEEKRRVVKTLIDRVIVGRGENGEARKITPILALEIPFEKIGSSAYGDQSPDYHPDAVVAA